MTSSSVTQLADEKKPLFPADVEHLELLLSLDLQEEYKIWIDCCLQEATAGDASCGKRISALVRYLMYNHRDIGRETIALHDASHESDVGSLSLEEDTAEMVRMIEDYIDMENCILDLSSDAENRIWTAFKVARAILALRANIGDDEEVLLCGIDELCNADIPPKSSERFLNRNLGFESLLRPYKSPGNQRQFSTTESDALPNLEYRRSVVRKLMDSGLLTSSDYNKIIRQPPKKKSEVKTPYGIIRRSSNRQKAPVISEKSPGLGYEQAIGLLDKSIDPFSINVKNIYWDRARNSWQAKWICAQGHRRRKSFPFQLGPPKAGQTRQLNETPQSALYSAIEFLSVSQDGNFEVTSTPCAKCSKMNLPPYV